MSTSFTFISQDLAERRAVWNQMLAHLDVDPGADRAPAVLQELRSTMRACGCCDGLEGCKDWLDRDLPGTPPFCRARDAFTQLAMAQGADIRRSA